MILSIENFCNQLTNSFHLISNERKLVLEKLSDYIKSKRSINEPVYLIYICTHNSRRSHFGQIWADVAAHFYKIKNVNAFSGGTEATAFNINAINALKRLGFIVKSENQQKNATYLVYHDENSKPSICYSKKYDDPKNPQSDFAAIMTCSDAEENCPFIPGVELRIATTYHDPKAFDNTPEQDAKYDERCKQIALETLYVFSKV